MSTFTLACHITISALTEVEADTLEEALEIASSRDVAYDQSGSDVEDYWIVSDFDGEPHNITEQAK